MSSSPSPKQEIRLTVSLDELARAVSALQQHQLEQLELAFSPREEDEIVQRRSTMPEIIEQNEHLTINDLKDDLL